MQMDAIRQNKNKHRAGQVMLEYVVALAICISMVVVCSVLLYGLKVFGGRVLSLVASFT